MPAVAARTIDAEAVVSDAVGDVHLLHRSVATIAEESDLSDPEPEEEGTTKLKLGPEPDLKMKYFETGFDSSTDDAAYPSLEISTMPDKFKVQHAVEQHV
jgi:hypothetical protein